MMSQENWKPTWTLPASPTSRFLKVNPTTFLQYVRFVESIHIRGVAHGYFVCGYVKLSLTNNRNGTITGTIIDTNNAHIIECSVVSRNHVTNKTSEKWLNFDESSNKFSCGHDILWYHSLMPTTEWNSQITKIRSPVREVVVVFQWIVNVFIVLYDLTTTTQRSKQGKVYQNFF